VNGASIDGWGKLKILEIENDKKNPTSAKIECRNSTLAKYYLAQKDIQKKGVDYFMKGELAGGVEPLLNKQVKTEEVECISKGEPRCLYSIFIEKDKLKCDFLKHIPFEEEKIIKKVSAITLKRKSGFSILNKGKIKFGDGEFKIEEVQGILYLSYVQAILEHVLLKNNKKEYFEIMDKISEESSRIIYEKVKGTRDLNEVFKKIEILGFGELKLRKISKNIFFASNSSNPVSKDYLKIFGKCSFSRDYLLSKIIEKTLKKILKKECVVSEEKCIARGDRKCLFKIKITK
jgi:predicted hydrocarbon binding protein